MSQRGDTNSSINCDLANLCGTCNALEAPWECCYWDEKQGSADRFQNLVFHPNHGRLHSQSWRSQLDVAHREADEVISTLHVKPAQSFHSHFIPEVKLADRDRAKALEVVRRLDVPIIAVSLGEFFDGTRKLKRLYKAQTAGLHKFLGFDRDIILTTDVSDSLCEYFLRRPKELKRTVDTLHPTFVTTPDTSCYHNLPATVSRYNIDRTIVATADLAETSTEIVGLALGSNSLQLLDHVKTLRKLGCKIIAVPLYEFRRSGQTDIARHRVQLVKSESGADVFALSCTPWNGRYHIRAKYYSSWSWFPPRRGQAFDPNATLARLRRMIRRCSDEASQEELA